MNETSDAANQFNQTLIEPQENNNTANIRGGTLSTQNNRYIPKKKLARKKMHS